jgi:ATP-binding cassette, subfamily G (WHITE), member 2
MVGYVPTAQGFFVFLAAYILFMLTSESIGVLCAVVTSSATYAVLLLTFVLLFLLSFSGFLVSDVPVYFAWISRISYLTYAFAAAVKQEFQGVEFVCQGGTPACVAGSVVPGAELVPAQIDNGLSVGVNLAVLLALCAGTRLLALGGIVGAFHLKKL